MTYLIASLMAIIEMWQFLSSVLKNKNRIFVSFSISLAEEMYIIKSLVQLIINAPRRPSLFI